MNPGTRYRVSVQAGAVKGIDGSELLESPYFSFWTSTEKGTQIQGRISEDTVWTKENSPYILAGQVEVTDGAKLTMEQGVEVQGHENELIFMNGSFESKGTAEERVIIENTMVEVDYYSKEPVTINYTDFSKGNLNIDGKGTLVLKDSIVNNDTRLNVQNTNSVIERNTFKLNYLYMELSSRGNHTIKNNVFYKGFNSQTTQKIVYYGSEWESGRTLLEHNSFIGGEGSKSPMVEVHNSSKGITAENNYWHTTEGEKIDDKIKDGKDQANEAAVLAYKPILTKAHENTPKLDALTITNVAPEPAGIGVSVNSEVIISFDQDINPSQLEKWKIRLSAENNAWDVETEVRVENEKVILSVPGGMNPGTRYRVSIQAGAVKGIDGSELLESPYFSFWTNTSIGPAIPHVNLVTDNTVEVTGVTEPKAVITVKIGYITIGTAIADIKGNYLVKILKQKAGTKLKVTATDAVGFISPAQEIEVVDASAPSSPLVDTVTDQSTSVSGSAEANSVVVVRNGTRVIADGTADKDGKYSIEISKQQAGLKLFITATDTAGNMSEAREITVSDVTAPEKPVVNKITDKTNSITGTAEAGTVVTVKIGTTEIGEKTVNQEGDFAIAIEKQQAGTELEIVAVDKAGNKSPMVKVAVLDATAPVLPTVKEVTDKSTEVKGLAEVDSIISVKISGLEIAKAKTNSEGNFVVAISKQIAGVKISITSTDVAGNVSEAKIVTVSDVTAPNAPTVDKVTDKTTVITGTGEVSSVISIKAGNTDLGTATTSSEGKYKVTIAPQIAGTKVQVTATDAAGNTSVIKEVNVEDATAPTGPTVNKVTDQSIVITGMAEAASLVSVKAGTSELGTATADVNGKFIIAISKQKADTNLTATATDAAGNVSEVTEITVLDVSAPEMPTAGKVTEQTTVVQGTGEINSVISIKAQSSVIGTATVNKEGNYEVSIPKQKAGTKLYITATDKAGNISEIKSATVVDETAPPMPKVSEVTDKSIAVKGSAEAASIISVKVLGKEIGKATAISNGDFEVTIPKQKAGTKLSVTATDAAGNSSEAKIVVVLDVTAPEAPLVNNVTDQTTTIKGTAEAASVVTVKVGENELGTMKADADGKFSIEITKQKAGLKLSVTATDRGGNVSEATEITVSDVTAPEKPLVNKVTDKTSLIIGTAEAGSVVTAKAGTTEIGKETVNQEGNFAITIEKQKAGTELELVAVDKAGNKSPIMKLTVLDATAPAIPTVKEVTDKSTTVIGSAEADSAITVNISDLEIGKAIVNSDGDFIATIPKQKASTKLSVTATDAAGNVSEAKIITVSDVTAPNAPTVGKVTDKSTAITGTGEESSVILVKSGNTELGTTIVSSEGTYNVTIPAQKAGTIIQITAVDLAGNISAIKEVTVTDVTAPAAPSVDKVTDNSTAVTGTAEAASLVSVIAGANELGTATADANGKFSIAIPKQKAGTELSITATDIANNVSDIKETTVLDETAPSLPKVSEVTDRSTTVKGSAEADSFISVKVSGEEIGKTTVNSNEDFEVTIPKQKAGTKLSITATDAAGNSSDVKIMFILDVTAPITPLVNEVMDQTTVITGTAEAKSLVKALVGESELGTATADADGNFSITILKQKAGIKISITAKDAAGNVSEAKIVTVSDVTAPSAPTVDKITDKTTIITGTGEVSSVISIKAGNTDLGTATTSSEGKYKVSIVTQKAGTKIQVTATDAAGNSSVIKEVIVEDATAPTAPSVNKVTDQSTAITGMAEAESLVSVKAGTRELGKVTADSDGNFSIAIPKQKADTKLSITATDAAGNISEVTVINVLDVTAPVVPTVEKVTDQTTVVQGTGEVSSVISIKVESSVIGTATVNKEGNYEVSIPKQKAGTKLYITATDKAGNISEIKSATVVDETAPPMPKVSEVTDKSIAVKGSAEAASIISVKVLGKEIGKATAISNGDFEVTIPKQKVGTKLSVTATDAAGNSSEAKILVVLDGTAPEAPIVNEVTDKATVITGTAEAGSLISVKAGETKVGTANTNDNGEFSIVISQQQAGTKLTITATDAAGNTSSAKEVVVVDVTAPKAPAVNNVTDQSTTVTGTAEAASFVTVKAGSKEIGTATVNADGNYSVTIPKQKVETVLSITATDKAGNISAVKEVIVTDGTPPVMTLESKVTHYSTRIIGTAEAGAIITVKAGSKSIGTATANEKGKYEVKIEKQKIGTKLSITAADAAGNNSKAIQVTVEDGNYPDLKLSHWALDKIMYLADEKIIGGYPNGTFQPEKNTTRAEAAKMLAIALDLPIEDVSSGYKDVTNKHWGKNYIAAASKAGLFTGNPDGTFAPNDGLKRAEMAKIISIAYELKSSNKNHFSDVKSGHWSKGYISGLFENGITTGYPDKTFRPGEPTTRAEFSVFLARAKNEQFR